MLHCTINSSMKAFWKKIKNLLRPRSFEEAYLNDSTDMADFERRLRQIEYRRFRDR